MRWFPLDDKGVVLPKAHMHSIFWQAKGDYRVKG